MNTELNLEGMQQRGKSNYLVVVLILAMLVMGFFLLKTSGVLQKNTAQLDETGTTLETSEGGERLTAWNIIKMTDWLFWPFVLITGVGILVILHTALAELQDKSRAQHLLRTSIANSDIQGIKRIIQISGACRASKLMHKMIAAYHKTNQAEPITDDIAQFITNERASFQTFNKVTSFLSESAGALGLLGTVWGIFLTFHAGKLDGPTILQGMSISLVTTLVGLIISLLLTLGATSVYTLFNGQLCLLATRAEELRQVLLYMEHNKDTEGTNEIEARAAQYVWSS